MPRRLRKVSALGHVVDAMTFRTLGVWIIIHEVIDIRGPDWQAIVAGFACFFMPDALRGRDSVWLRAILRLLPAASEHPEEK